jgi:DNA-binding transcriptional MerR regulator
VAKGPDAFRTISEAADEVGVPQHVLRFWETKFAFIRPMKRAGGRRFYRPADLDVLRTVRRLLHEEGYTIKGVQRLYKEGGASRFGIVDAGEGDARAPGEDAPDGAPDAQLGDEDAEGAEEGLLDVDAWEELLQQLQDAKARLDAVLPSD